MDTDALKAMQRLQAATVAARTRTGDARVSTQLSGGLVAVVYATPPASGRGSYVVEIIRDGLTIDQAVAFLDAMK